MNRCDQFQKLISDNLDTPLDSGMLNELQEHLASCDDCVRFSETAGNQDLILKSLPIQQPEGDAIEVQITDVRTGMINRLWHLRIRVPLPVAAAALLIFVAWQLIEPETTPSESIQGRPAAQSRVEYLQTERMQPAVARLISSNQTKSKGVSQ